MVQEYDKGLDSALRSQEQATNLIEQVTKLAQPEAVFSTPVTAGDHTLVTASEVFMGLGMGYGIGSGEGNQEGQTSTMAVGQTAGRPTSSAGGGGGGGGGGMARPVALITVGPAGVKIEPIVDVTKLALAVLTTIGTMALMRARMRRGG